MSEKTLREVQRILASDITYKHAATQNYGRFITFEGGEGAGKSTQVRDLIAHLSLIGVKARATREPGGSPRAELLRDFLLSGRAAQLGSFGEAVLFNAARIDHIDTLIVPGLARGEWVICDRFSDSTRAYQGAAGKTPAHLIAGLEQVTVGECRPDLTILMDIAPETGLARARKRSAISDRFEDETLAFHNALRMAFLDIAAAEPQRFYVVDATLPPEDIAADIWRVLHERFGIDPTLPPEYHLAGKARRT